MGMGCVLKGRPSRSGWGRLSNDPFAVLTTFYRDLDVIAIPALNQEFENTLMCHPVVSGAVLHLFKKSGYQWACSFKTVGKAPIYTCKAARGHYYPALEIFVSWDWDDASS